VNVFRSAWIPAPPPESEPAIVSAITRGISHETKDAPRDGAAHLDFHPVVI